MAFLQHVSTRHDKNSTGFLNPLLFTLNIILVFKRGLNMKAMTIALLYLGGRYHAGNLLAYYAPNCVKALDAALGLQCSCQIILP